VKVASGKVTVDEKVIKDMRKEYIEKMMNEENEWDHRISAEVKEGPADCIRIDIVAALKKITRMWANSQRDGCPAEYRWRPLFNAAKFG